MTKQGKLIVCATPIGNLGDVTQRVITALEQADVVCAEDTRVTGKLLSSLSLKKRLERLDEAMLSRHLSACVERIKNGEVIAYCSDAGMPGVADPGLRLVDAAREAGCDVEVLPGATALTCAYVSSGFSCAQFYFGGFFPRKQGERLRALEIVSSLDAVLIYYESPHRIISALESIAAILPARRVAVCRELTKLHEEVLRDDAASLADILRERQEQGLLRGEIVLVIDAPSKSEEEQEQAARLEAARAFVSTIAGESAAGEGMPSVKEITQELKARFGLSRNEAYEIAIQAQRGKR